MATDTASVKINKHKHQFELHTDGKLSYVVYEAVDDDNPGAGRSGYRYPNRHRR